MRIFGGKAEANLKSTREMVERVISELGLAADDNRLQTDDGSLAWGLMRGSAQVYIFVRPGEDEQGTSSIQVIAPVMKIPPSKDAQLPLFHRLLELNAQQITGAAFAIKDDTVVILTDRSTQDLDRSEVKEMILRVGYFADTLDDSLVRQFGGQRYSD